MRIALELKWPDPRSSGNCRIHSTVHTLINRTSLLLTGDEVSRRLHVYPVQDRRVLMVGN